MTQKILEESVAEVDPLKKYAVSVPFLRDGEGQEDNDDFADLKLDDKYELLDALTDSPIRRTGNNVPKPTFDVARMDEGERAERAAQLAFMCSKTEDEVRG